MSHYAVGFLAGLLAVWLVRRINLWAVDRDMRQSLARPFRGVLEQQNVWGKE